MFFFFFFKQKTAYEMRISDWSSDVCSSDLNAVQSSLWFGAGNEGRQSILGILPLFHVFAMTVVMNWSMRVGGEMILLPRLDLTQLLQHIPDKKPTAFAAVPILLTDTNTYSHPAEYVLRSPQAIGRSPCRDRARPAV